LLCELALTHDRLITLEEHSLDGGFGSAVVELFNDRRIRTSVERIGCPNVLMQQNSQPKQRAQVGLSAEAIVERIRTPLGTPASV
jgi:1-deoxy-D-xylulose-5-phosphate synthase